MKIKINNDYKCFMSIPNINFWYDYEGRKLFIGWLWWGIDLIFKGYDVEDADRVHSATMDSTSPELKESEDERIRKKLIEAVKGDMVVGGTKDKQRAIAWLEKQGKSKFEPCIQEGDKLVTNEDGTHFNIGQLERVAKKEPKFKVGDWIVQKGLGTYKIVEICESWYEVISYKDGIQYSIGFDKENDCHLWTIQDAKDGDVLACPLPEGCEGGEQIFMFKSINSRDYVDDCIEFYCRVCEGVFYENKNGYMGTTSSPLYPATKEQRELLFSKMKEEGYEWDAEKKELKKIESNPAWSEEDEQMLNHIICDIESLKEEVVYCKTVCDEEIDWIKSLKERVKGE